MLFVGNQRGGARNLAAHLLSPENEHVEVHEVRGFASESVAGAFNEAYAMSRGTKCTQFLFSLSVNPPQDQNASIEDFESAIDLAEDRLGLSGQPRTIVFHEKNGRRHAHAVWSRIDSDKMKAVQLSFTHKKLQEVSRELHIQHGWQMPRGMVDKSLRDPKNFTLDEWQQAKRQGEDPRVIKAAFQDAWATSDSKPAFSNALKERGYTLARGDRRGYVAIDRHGEIYAVAKWSGVKTKSVRERLGDPKSLPDIEIAKQQIASEMQPSMERLNKELDARRQKQQALFDQRKADLIARHADERKATFEKMDALRIQETKIRQERFRTGMKGLWDRLRGEHRRIQKQNEHEAYQAFMRDRAAKDALIFRQLEQRQNFEAIRKREEQRFTKQSQDLQRDARQYQDMQKTPSKQDFMDRRQVQQEKPSTRHEQAQEP